MYLGMYHLFKSDSTVSDNDGWNRWGMGIVDGMLMEIRFSDMNSQCDNHCLILFIVGHLNWLIWLADIPLIIVGSQHQHILVGWCVSELLLVDMRSLGGGYSAIPVIAGSYSELPASIG